MVMSSLRLRSRFAHWLGLLTVAAALIAGLLALLDMRQPSTPRFGEPWRAEALLTPAESRARVSPRGGRVEEDGSLTILHAPPTQGKAEPRPNGMAGWSNRAQSFEPVPNAMMGGIKALFRLVPGPPRPGDELIVTTLERRTTEGRLMLVRGCLRFNAPDGPIAVLPPGSVLGLREGYLTVGPPGLPPAQSARVGERIFWEDYPWTRFDAATQRRGAERCGPGLLAYVLPWSASVQQVDRDSFRAEELARDQGLTWREAYREVRRCGERARMGIARETPGREPPAYVETCHYQQPTMPRNPGNCPSATRWKDGNCLDQRGQVVPVPSPAAGSR